MKKYKVGIIGYGGFGKFLHHWWSKLENVQVTAVADHGSHIKEAENCRVYYDWKELLNDPEIDIVSIVTPPHLHSEMACAAMEAGKHVLLEKPLSVTEQQAEDIFRVQRKTERVITVNHMIRYNPIINAVVDLTQNGSLGRLRHAVVNNYAQDESLPETHWFWDESMSGGIMVEHGVHFFDIINAIGGQKYTEVYGVSHKRNDLQRDRVSAMVLYSEGLIASYYHAFSGPGFFEQTTIKLVFDLARVTIEGWMPMKGHIKALVNTKTREKLASLPKWFETKSENFEKINDVSRPEGWGASESAGMTGRESTLVSGILYEVDQIVTGTFEVPLTKGEVYGSCVQQILGDMILKIEDQDHILKITLEDAFEALKTAMLASK
ncbi:Gfo/Idh/MocA family protein [Flavobacterium sp. SORGH_AS_0622]|uniref:Gfo/Idh/MocA family protein n=1 Tax=Flavobacterium sp. SORGH_AS_0622 TaxID=3041772 RepID=UPI0027810949|nr:Gfo/Idh/MocA family oxidoreductase [Flavobacterium sp. SORGH_AS_0622]MDQ1165634.1 putative dehydrogenase [Flavobacterium sp. SORGH_AS_0622]